MYRPRVSWMTNADTHILEFLHNGGNAIYATPAVIAYNIDFTRNYVSKRMAKLQDHGLVRYDDKTAAMYAITDRGRAYLAGELDASDLEDIG